jgi:electron transport complex protein RnfB
VSGSRRGHAGVVEPALPSQDREPTLADRIDAQLPQTQCTRCGYPDCRAYAEAIAQGDAEIDRCPPGGAQGVERLAAVTGRPIRAIDPAHGREGPRLLAVIDEAWCIGCTLCIKACPVDCIIGAPRQMHTILPGLCTGCELCVPPCPVDCIDLHPIEPQHLTGWDAWSEDQARQSRQRYDGREERLEREQHENDRRLAEKAASKLADLAAASAIQDTAVLDRKRALVTSAVERARARATRVADPTPPKVGT